MSVDKLIDLFDVLNINSKNKDMANVDIQTLLTCAINAALEAQKKDFDAKISNLVGKISSLEVKTPTIEKYEEIKIFSSIPCDESLDIVKSIPEFNGNSEQYISWRQAAHTAYKVFEKYENSSKHYQAVAIIRNKVRGSADAVLASFNTVLNFKAIIARLDFTYSDKRPIYLIEQELSTLRQGSLTVIEFYDAIEKKLSMLTNKTAMTYEKSVCQTFNEKYRADALRTFVSGLKKPLCDILFSARPTDLPTALALAQEVEANHERYLFASAFSNREKGKDVQPVNYNKIRDDVRQKKTNTNFQNFKTGNPIEKNPHFKQILPKHEQTSQQKDNPEPMDVDPSSSKFRQPTNYQSGNNYQKRQNSERMSARKFQKINYIAEDSEPYEEMAENEVLDIEQESEVNFLGESPSYLSSNEC